MCHLTSMSVSCAELEFILSPPKARSPCLQRACKVRDTHVRCRASMRRLRSLRHAYVGGTGHARWRHGCRGPGWHLICICRQPKPYRQRTSEVHCRALYARVCYVPAGEAAHAAVIAHCSITAACSCVSQNTHRRRASAVLFSAFRLPNPTQTRRREVHGGLWPRLKMCHCHNLKI